MIVRNQSDLGMEYDLSFVDTKVLSVPSYDPIYVLTENNTPQDVAMMIIDAIDKKNCYIFFECALDAYVEDVRVWFSHPEDDNELLTSSFWREVDYLLYIEQQDSIKRAVEWEEECYAMNSARQRELVYEYNYGR